jgi:amidohydrolase
MALEAKHMSADVTMGRLKPLLENLEKELPDAVQLRHEIHADPQISGFEGPTAARVSAALGRSDAPDIAGGRVIRIGSSRGPAVAIRGELDALPIRETTLVPWRSTNGAMHACGHDVHLAALVAVARTLADQPIPMVALLQPREEAVPGGALDIVQSGALQDAEVRAVIGAHVHPRIRVGEFSAYPGVMNASSDEFTITITGRGGHGAYPHATTDPISAASSMIVALQQIVARRSDPMEPTVITVGSIHSGAAANAIPDEAVLTGTIRAYDRDHRETLHALITETAQHVVAVHGCTVNVEIRLGEPALRNDERLALRLGEWAQLDGVVQSEPHRSCGADDFAFYGEILPSVMAFVGSGSEHPDEPELHSSNFLPPDELVRDTARIMIAGYLAACDLL